MVRYVTALYVGGRDTDPHFKQKMQYPIVVKRRWWRREVSIYQRRGYYDQMLPNTLRHYIDQAEFNQTWKIIEEE